MKCTEKKMMQCIALIDSIAGKMEPPANASDDDQTATAVDDVCPESLNQ